VDKWQKRPKKQKKKKAEEAEEVLLLKPWKKGEAAYSLLNC